MYSGLQYSAIVYEGFLPAAPAVTGTVGPTSNVLDFKEVSGRLGCGEPTFFITSRCANGLMCVLDNSIVTHAQWDRRLDDISEAEVTIDLTGDTNYTCCECLNEAEPWCHELHIWRDGEEVWVGPIQEIEYEYNTVTVRAKDTFAWLGVRIPPININFVGTGTDLTNIAIFVINTAFASEPDTCEPDNIYSQLAGAVYDFFAPKFETTAIEILRQLSDAGLNFTALGKTMVIVGDSDNLTPLILLNDEHIFGGITIRKDGTIMGNRYYVHFDGDGGDPTISEAADFYCYGPIERLISPDGISNGANAGDIGDTYVAAAGIAPRTIEMPPGAKLSPDTPWTINEMVPGARVDVAVTKFCLNLTQSFLLTAMSAEYDADGGESIGITLTPINSVAVAP